MLDAADKVVIRTFNEISEIESLPGFSDKNPINKDNYKKIIGDYNFEESLKCCFKKENGNLCLHDHKFGYVVELKDKSVSIIGNCCAKDKFDADAQIRIDRAKYNNRKRYEQVLQNVNNLLCEANSRVIELEGKKSALIGIKQYCDRVGSELGKPNFNRLMDMARTRNSVVLLAMITKKMGRIRTEMTLLKNGHSSNL